MLPGLERLRRFARRHWGGTILQHAENIGIAVHGLYDVNRRKWVWNDSLALINWQDTNPDTWLADASGVGSALYPDIFGSVFAELWAVPSTGGEQVDSLRYNDGWEFLNLTAPGWYERASYDSFPNNFYGYLAALCSDVFYGNFFRNQSGFLAHSFLSSL